MKRIAMLMTFAFASTGLAAESTTTKTTTTAQTTTVTETTTAKEVSITAISPAAVAEFKLGRDLWANVRPQDAARHFEKAIAADPGFALAHAYLAISTFGGQRLKEIEKAEAALAALPEAEKTLIQAIAASVRGNVEKERMLVKTLAELAPGDWYVQLYRGQLALAQRNWVEAESALLKATELNPMAAPAFNTLGYARLNQGKHDGAIEAFTKYATLAPKEPNPHDSLGDALLQAGRITEAETAFTKALAIDPSFSIAWQGVAQARFLRGDKTGGYEALAKYKATSTRSVDQLAADTDLAWYQAAHGDTAACHKTLDTIEAAAKIASLGSTYAYTAINRGWILLDAGKLEETAKQADLALTRADNPALGGATVNAIRRQALALRASAEARLGKTAEAEKSLAALELEVKKVPGNATAQSLLDSTKGEVALARGDVKLALKDFARCIPQDSYCRWMQAQAQDKAGDPAAAAKTRKDLVAANFREADYLFVRAHAEAMKVAAPTAPKRGGVGGLWGWATSPGPHAPDRLEPVLPRGDEEQPGPIPIHENRSLSTNSTSKSASVTTLAAITGTEPSTRP